ncbi:hypothetical protein RsTz2092_06950 [Deferribacterales bacterium RsTz2092]|nr:hypothetical protein AGMMS49941_05100 [Deferribacterales bacterium]
MALFFNPIDDALVLTGLPADAIARYFTVFDERCRVTSDLPAPQVRHLDLGIMIVRLENYIGGLTNAIESELAYCLREPIGHYDATLKLWKEQNTAQIVDFNNNSHIIIYKEGKQAIELAQPEYIKAFDENTNTYYYTYQCLSDEPISSKAIAKMGHILVRQLYEIVRDRRQNALLAHAAAIGVNGKGALLCARGGHGKSTLALSALIDGFQYVSDDYIVLARDGEHKNLCAYPIYSCATLTKEMLERLKGLRTEFLFDNWNKTKDVFNLSAHHSAFVPKLPIKVAIYPNIANVVEPSIERTDSNKAMTHFIHSILAQMQDKKHLQSMTKLMIELLKGLDFYQINLSNNLIANVKALKSFMEGV